MSALGRAERGVIGGVAVFTAVAGIGHYAGWASILAFVFATVALAGLAHVVSVGVESVGEMLGAGIAGFMQATLGNLPGMALLAAGGVGAAFVSDWFVTALAPTVDQLGISRAFAGLVTARRSPSRAWP